MAIRASTEVGPVTVSVAPSARTRRKPARPGRVPVLKLPATRVPAGLPLPRRVDLPPPVAPAGWYPDPEDAARMRWWNGTKWTRRFAEPGAASTAKVRTRTADAPPRLRPAQRPARRRLLPNVDFSGNRGAQRPVRGRRTRRSERG